ncbi:MAG: NADH-quinone oxidoreductase subunit C [Kineosporiaceae bacterium]
MTTEVRRADRSRVVAQAQALLDEGWRLALVAAHQDQNGFRVVYLFLRPGRDPLELWLPVPGDDVWIPTLSGVSYPGGRFEREVRDLYGIDPRGHPLPRRMVRHGHWPAGYYPMLSDAAPHPPFEPDVGSYPFVEVHGDGVYEIPVGPVHAGLIEPGHFRFSVVGETILRMKARLWFVHRGVEKLFEGRPVEDGIELAERISGDTAVGHTLAYVMAVEQATGARVCAADHARRALLLELERLYNHVNDLGAIVNDVGHGILHAHTQRLREDLLRHNKHVTGHRLLRGGVRIGGATLRAEPDLGLLRRVARETAEIVEIALGNHVVADRLAGTAILDGKQARLMGTLGYVARASGLTIDARVDHPFVELPSAFRPAVRQSGDVEARFLVRAEEVAVSTELVAQYARMTRGSSPSADPAGGPAGPGQGLGIVEAWRGTLCHRIEIDAGATLRRVKIVDPSFFNWPALPVALADTIVPDFPLANKSFNQSYAGNDL